MIDSYSAAVLVSIYLLALVVLDLSSNGTYIDLH